jgi:hypothetical protein
MCQTTCTNAKATNLQRAAVPDADADIDQFSADNHDDIAAKLAAGREQIARGEAAPLSRSTRCCATPAQRGSDLSASWLASVACRLSAPTFSTPGPKPRTPLPDSDPANRSAAQ